MASKRKANITQMSDIARIAGVSKSTVSRALADSPLVSEKTRSLIQKIAREENYRLNVAARNFRLQSTLTVAVLLPAASEADWRLSDPFFLELLGSIAEALDDHGHQLLLTRTAPQEGDWIEDFIQNRRADGVILIGQGSQHETINRLAQSYKAISVWGARMDGEQAYPVVGTDNKLGGYRATRHMLDKGRSRIAFIGFRELPELEQRYQGYCDALKQAGLDVPGELTIHVSSGTHQLVAELKQLIDEGVVFDGIFAATDVYAMTAIRVLESNNIRVPQDVSVVGYDDISIASYYNPSLTTICQNRSVGGKILVDNLLEALEGHKPEAIILNPELIVRESS